MNNRLVFLDEVKGLAILLVVMGHVLAWNGMGTTADLSINEYGNLMFQFIYGFHMPLFFCVSGFLFKSNNNLGDLSQSLIGKVKRLLIPFMATGTLVYIVMGGANWGYWFLLSLFEIYFFHSIWDFVYRLLVKKESIISDCLFLLLGFLILKLITALVLNKMPVFYGIDFAKFNIYYLPFALGHLWKKNNWIGTFLESQIVYNICLILFVLIFAVRVIYGESNFIAAHGKTIMSISACICILSLFKHSKRPTFVTRLLSYMGKQSLQIYILHIMFVFQFCSVGLFICKQDFLNSILLQILYSVSLSVIAIILSVICSYIISHSKLLNTVLFGIQNKK